MWIIVEFLGESCRTECICILCICMLMGAKNMNVKFGVRQMSMRHSKCIYEYVCGSFSNVAYGWRSLYAIVLYIPVEISCGISKVTYNDWFFKFVAVRNVLYYPDHGCKDNAIGDHREGLDEKIIRLLPFLHWISDISAIRCSFFYLPKYISK